MAQREPQTRFVLLDGLRGVAAMSVMLFHCSLIGRHSAMVPHGYLAVDFFFLLSGFVIALAYETRLRSDMRFGEFAVRRAIRLYPLAILAGLAAIALAAVKTLHFGTAFLPWSAILFGLLLLPNPMQIGQNDKFTLNFPTWSLFYELAVNLGYALVARVLTMRLLVLLIAAAFAYLVWAVSRHGSIELGTSVDSEFAAFVRTLFSFGMGVLIYRLHAQGRLPSWHVPPALLALALLAILFTPGFGPYPWSYDLIAVGLLHPAIIVLGRSAHLGRVSGLMMHWLGELSYPIYVLHVPVSLYVALALGGVHLPREGQWAVAAIAVLAASVVALRIDYPVRRWLTRRLLHRPRLAEPLATLP